MPWCYLARLFDAVAELDTSADWPVRLGERLNITAHGPTGFAALGAETVGGALRTLVDCYRARITTFDMQLGRRQGQLLLTLDDQSGDPIFFERVGLIVMKVVESLLVAILGPLPESSMDMSLPLKECDEGRRVAARYCARVRFAGYFSLSIPSGWWAVPSPLHDAVGHRKNVMECRRIIEQRNDFASATGMVEYFLRAALASDASNESGSLSLPGLESVARQNNITARTLIRRLKIEGTSFQALTEALRKEYAESLLAEAGLSIGDIALRLGYTESANFVRAFRRWHGISPAAWRRARGVMRNN